MSNRFNRRSRTQLDFVSTTNRFPNNSTKRIKKLLFFAVVIVVPFLVSCIVSAQYLLHSSSIPSDRPYGVVIASGDPSLPTKHIALVYFDPNHALTKVVNIPDQTIVETSVYGSYPISALYGLYALDHKPVDVFLRTIIRTFGVDVGALIISSSNKAVTAQSLPSILWQTVKNQNQTSLSFTDRFTLWWNISHQSIQDVPIPSEVIMIQHVLSKEVVIPVLPDFDSWIVKTFPHNDIEKEALTIAIVNASGTQRLASIAGREFLNMGMNVLSIGDLSPLIERGKLIVASNTIGNSHTAALVQKITGLSATVDSYQAQQGRADIVVFLGKQEVLNISP